MKTLLKVTAILVKLFQHVAVTQVCHFMSTARPAPLPWEQSMGDGGIHKWVYRCFDSHTSLPPYFLSLRVVRSE